MSDIQENNLNLYSFSMQSDTIQHFILTRFNLRLWPHDKNGRENGTSEWLAHRFSIFERYCLPSLAGQTDGNFCWILLLDNGTPDEYRKRMEEYKVMCPQMNPVYVAKEQGRHFADVFRKEVAERTVADRIITTYLDNDDCLARDFVKDVQERYASLPDHTFLSYADGYQLFSEFGLMLQIHYPRNHFMSVIEPRAGLRTVYGYGSHYYIDRIPGARIEFVNDSRLWCEVVHGRNMGNDAYFIVGTQLVKDKNTVERAFSVDLGLKDNSRWMWFARFLPRYARTFVQRARFRLFGRNWWK